ncbi:MAG: MraY family glycosyltransferase [Tissierellia bacterium]|nr:MraY family glycosyltransferase [Tissierellia bacterium]
MNNFYILLVAFLAAFILTPLNIHMSRHWGLVDVPKDNRRMHEKPVATVGGVSIFLAFLITVLLFLKINTRIIFALVGSGIMVITGIVDDKRNLRPRTKLLLQIAAALVAVIGGFEIGILSNPFVPGQVFHLGIFGPILSILWIVGISNALNFVDGMDGLCAGISAISALTFYFALQEGGAVALMSLALGGACLGFLPYNFNPAKIFMGDTGALFLGYMLALISIDGVLKSVATMSLLLPLFILALPLVDTIFAILRRTVNKRGIMSADKGHLHHRLVSRGFSVRKTVLILYGMSILFSILGLILSHLQPSIALVIAGVTFVIIFMLGFLFGLFRKESDTKHQGGIH